MVHVLALYQFTPVTSPKQVQKALRCAANPDILGTLIIAKEGINGTICGRKSSLDAMLEVLSECGFNQLEYKFSNAKEDAFLRFKVICKDEIVTLGKTVDPLVCVGEYVKPEDWNALITSEDVLLIDTRNHYEFSVGTFKGAVNPNTRCFREFPEFVATLNPKKYRKVAMFCTGGIRCEKASAYMLSQGFEKLYHLKGGILKYLEEIPKRSSLWEGDCFVFDRRVAVTHGLKITDCIMCYACRAVLPLSGIAHPDYVEGVSCEYCRHTLDDKRYTKLVERQKQVMLSKQKGSSHFQGHTISEQIPVK
ncbi:rhodanese-related sulfurtransferase [Gammaproteobacteria bacterium]|nr:rhodanese-related sulfurtransferase [Gammaproteobacteria bacterium]